MLSISSLKIELELAGAFESCEAQTWAKAGFLLGCFGVFAWSATFLPIAVTAALLPLSLMFLVPAAMLAHEGGHGSFSRSPFRNELLLHILFPLLAGKGAIYWKFKHNDNHHITPNVVDGDPDLNLWPMASHAGQYRRSNVASQWCQRNIQGWLLWPLTLGLVWSMRFTSFATLGRLAREGQVNGAWFADLVCMLAHYVCWVVLPVAYFGPMAALYYVAIWSLTGPIIAGVFGPAHMGMPMKFGATDPILNQMETTRNIDLPGILPYMYIGLGNQIEHHLFPEIAHQRMHIAVPIVKRWAEASGVEYQTIGWLEGWADMTRYINNAWKIEIPPMAAEIDDVASIGAAA
jgi:fatty acid desaturase